MIESYDFGTIIIDGKTFTSDCIITQKTIDAQWWRRKAHELCVDDIKEIIERENPEAVVVGTGKYGIMKILTETEDFLKGNGIAIYVQSTDEAVTRFNEMTAKKRTVGFFHLTC